ncbi:MAG: DNA ligase [Polyangiaceae bacterium]
MPRDLDDGETIEVQGSGREPYQLKNTGGVYSCTCPAWRNQSFTPDRRTCKHLRALRGDAAEQARLGSTELQGRPVARPPVASSGTDVAGEETSAAADKAPALLLAHTWETHVDLTGWWMSEKLDGVRAYWDGTRFISRLGNVFFAPPWFTEVLPNTPLDGELFGGRKNFQRTVGIVKRADGGPLWKELQYWVFDAPSHGGTFEERVEWLRANLEGRAPHVVVLAQQRTRDMTHVRDELQRVESLGGEGLMMRRPGSRYEGTRSMTLLKLKSFFDAEAKVIEHLPGAGRHKGRLGALACELPDGTRFSVGTGFSDAERADPPPVGSVITFRYQELSNAGVPRFPSYVGVRPDVSWDPSKREPTPARAAAPAAAALSATAGRAEPERDALERPEDGDEAPRYRRFEHHDGETHSFWEIQVEGSVHRVRYGTFERGIKRYASDDEARSEAERRIEQKLSKGFEEVED